MFPWSAKYLAISVGEFKASVGFEGPGSSSVDESRASRGFLARVLKMLLDFFGVSPPSLELWLGAFVAPDVLLERDLGTSVALLATLVGVKVSLNCVFEGVGVVGVCFFAGVGVFVLLEGLNNFLGGVCGFIMSAMVRAADRI